jgi:hypothetical protein
MAQVIAGLERAPAPFLLNGGTADASWDGTIARRVTPHVVEVAGADHGMCAPGQLTDSITILSQVVTAIDRGIPRHDRLARLTRTSGGRTETARLAAGAGPPPRRLFAPSWPVLAGY